jgi:hypothetical protein
MISRATFEVEFGSKNRIYIITDKIGHEMAEEFWYEC